MQVENLGFSVLCTHLTPDLQPNGLDYCKLGCQLATCKVIMVMQRQLCYIMMEVE